MILLLDERQRKELAQYSPYIAIPKVSSQNRRYIPMDYLEGEIIPGDKLFTMPSATSYEFGILMSNVHMAWTRAVCGRLKSDYSYSNMIVYNNFPWPSPTNDQKEKMSLEELRANMEKSKKELEHAIHNKNILEQRKRIVERKERSHRLIVKGAEFEKAFPLSRDLEQEEVQDVMEQLQNSSYNKSIVRQVYIAALHKEQQQIAEAVERAEKGDDS